MGAEYDDVKDGLDHRVGHLWPRRITAVHSPIAFVLSLQKSRKIIIDDEGRHDVSFALVNAWSFDAARRVAPCGHSVRWQGPPRSLSSVAEGDVLGTEANGVADALIKARTVNV
jgi:hypothetical protein